MARPKKNTKHAGGRPTVFTPEVLQKLEQGFKIGLTDTECCCYADINLSTLYEYQKRNPEFLYKKEKWKQNPIAKAKHTIYKNLDDAKTAQWYLERKCKEEFSTQSKLELESKGINIVVADDEHKQMLEDL
jgi:hypothetical protein